MKLTTAVILALALNLAMDVLRIAVVMWPWNGVLVALFGLPVLNFWAACGIVILCSILFKGCVRITAKRE